MILQLQTIGASDPLVRHAIVGLGEHNALWFRGAGRDIAAPSTWGVIYRPDQISPAIILYDAPTLFTNGEGSCGTLAAAVYGWARARGQAASTLLIARRSDAAWHIQVRFANGKIWNPETEVRRAA